MCRCKSQIQSNYMLAKFEDANSMLVMLRDQPVKNNPEKFPDGYAFQVDK